MGNRRNLNLYLIILLLILALGFGLRYYGFHHPHKHTFDESAYAILGYQITHGLSNYHTRDIYQDSLRTGRNLPEKSEEPIQASLF